MSVFGVILVSIFPRLDWIRRDAKYLSIFGKIRTRITPNTDTFHAVNLITEKLEELSSDDKILKGFLKKRRILLSNFPNSPKPIEPQTISLCLKVFLWWNDCSFKTSQNDCPDDKFEFFKFFKIANVKDQLEDVYSKGETRTVFPADNYMFKVNNRNTRTRCEICSKLTIKIPRDHSCEKCSNFVNKEATTTGLEPTIT